MKKFAKILLVAMSLNLIMSAAFADAKKTTGESVTLDCPAGSDRATSGAAGNSTDTKEVKGTDATKGE